MDAKGTIPRSVHSGFIAKSFVGGYAHREAIVDRGSKLILDLGTRLVSAMSNVALIKRDCTAVSIQVDPRIMKLRHYSCHRYFHRGVA